MLKRLLLFVMLFAVVDAVAQDDDAEFKQRVLESTEIDLLSSYYTQDGSNAAVTGGLGTEDLQNYPVNIVVSIPLNADDVLTIDAGVSAYTSASSSNLNPFDGRNPADPFVASSGASGADALISASASYSHSSDDRNGIWSLKASVSAEYDYNSIGFGGGYTHLFNEKNTSVSLHADVYLDNWRVLYPYELGGDAEGSRFNIRRYVVTGNQNYQPVFTPYDVTTRNSYNFSLGLSQILSEDLQGSLSFDLTLQDGQLANHMQRVYFADFEDSFIQNFHLADDVERLPDSRVRTAVGGRLNYFLNEYFVARGYYRYYSDDWGINSHTVSIEVPIKLLGDGWTLYPSYRFYTQTAADYFAPYNQLLSTSEFYTSDYDLSAYDAQQFGFGVSYTDIFTSFKLGLLKFKSIDLRYEHYKRDTDFSADIITGGFKFILDDWRN